MKNVLRIVTVALTVVMMVSAFVAPVSADRAVDDLSSYGQQTFEVRSTTTPPDVTDGVIEEGEYGEAVATYTTSDDSVSLVNWTKFGNAPKPLTNLTIQEIIPDSMTMYCTYDAEYLYMALKVIKADHYSVVPQIDGYFWGSENWTVRLYMDAFADGRDEDEIWTYGDAFSYAPFTVCAGYTSVAGAPNEAMAFAGENCPYQYYDAWDEMEGCGASRDDTTQTTIYEFKAAWANIWGDGDYGAVPEMIPVHSQYVLSDSRYLDSVPATYVSALGAVEWGSIFTAAQLEELGIAWTYPELDVHQPVVPQILKFVDAAAINEANRPVEVTTTEAATTEAATTEAATTEAATTEAATKAPVSATTTTAAPAEEKGCGSVIGFGAIAVLTAAAAVVALKKKD